MKFLLRLAAALALAAPITCQSEVTPYFALSTNRTFGSADEPTVNLTGINVQSVLLRVYRINNPVQFYTQLEDTHSFGLNNPRLNGKQSLLEKLRDWKRELRRNIRLNLRAQFTESPSAHFRNASPASGNAGSKETYFADAPVLNQEQLVLSFRQPVASVNRWSENPVPIHVKERGVFLVEAVHGDLRAYTILNVSDTVLITKIGRSGVLAFAANRQTGEPIPRLALSQIDPHGTTETFQTNSDGMAELPAPKAGTVESLRLLAVNGRDVAFNEIPTYMNRSDANWTGYVYTDRPVYRPGDPMHFRGILRLQEAVGYKVPASQPVNVEITDPDGKNVYQKTITTSANGIIHDDFAVEKTAALGNYYIQVHGAESVMSGSFEVQEYKKPEYEVHVTADKARVLEGESVKAVIDARYYFGEPVNGAKVHYSVHRSRYWFPYWYEPGEDGEEGGEDQQFEDANSEEVSQGDGELDADGKLSIDVPTTVSENRLDYSYSIEAGVTDKGGREITGTGYVLATFGTFNLSVEPTSYVAKPGTIAGFKVSARDYDTKPVITAVHLTIASFDRREHKYNKIESQSDATTAADGAVAVNLPIPAASGEFQITATAKAGPRSVVGTTRIYAAGDGFDWGYQTQKTVQIIPDKKLYKSGDMAKIMLITGQANTPVLVTVEGRDLRRHQLIRSVGATAEFDYTVTEDDQPGFFVSAQFLRNGELYQSQKRVSVPPEDHKMEIKVATDKPQYLPGQTANYTLHAATPDGTPLANADLSLGVVDEAIYAIRKDATPDIINFFYGREYDAVNTQNSLNFYFNGEAGTRRMRLAEMRGASKLAQLKPEQLVKPKVRKIFPDTAFWAADVTTDASGDAKAQVPFPDSLTTWRATVRGVAPGERFGSQTSKIIVRKNLIMRLAVPRFFVQGDEVVISGIVHNYLAGSKSARVSLTLEGLDIIGGSATQQVEIAPKTEAKVDWRVKARQVRSAKITGEALTNEESDALELTLPVNPPGIELKGGESGSIANSGSSAVTMTFPSSAVTGSRSLSIRLSPSVAGSIFGALEYLTSYPYGCVEQTMSSFLPDLMVAKSLKELSLTQPIDEAALNEKMQAGLSRLYNFQHSDGGWGWWETDETHPFMTAYVVAGLAEARADGVPVQVPALERGAASIEQQLGANGKQIEPDLRAYMAFALVMAGRPSAQLVNTIYEDRKRLSPYGEALLGLILNSTKDTRAATLAAHLEQEAHTDGGEAFWPATRDAMLDFEADITPEASAYVMKFLSRQSPQSALLPKAALYLVNHRNEGYWWSSTKQTAMVIYGLIDYLKTTNELHPNLSATVTVNGRSVASPKFDSASALPEILLDESKLQAAGNQIQITSTGSGRLYYSVASSYFSNEARLEKNGAVSLNILRDYFRLVPGKKQDRIVYDLSPLYGSVTPGDTIAVCLTVTGSDWKYLLMEDPIPAGTEFIERDNLYEINNKPPWWEYWFSRRELHDNRMAIFQTHFSEGQKQYFYLLKVVNPGLFQVNPARVEPMYQPGHLATTEARMLEVK
jgi:uncharacterized protein YfaS (alpha-2-macroglobulin family)